MNRFLFLSFFVFLSIFSCTEKPIETPTSELETENINEPTLKSGSTYYVAKTGSDSNSGSSTSPFLTIQKAANIAGAGDVVIIRDGVYTTSSGESLLSLSRSGSSSGYITFKAENKGKAVLDGRNSTGYGIILSGGASYIKIMDLEIKNFLWMGIHCNNSTPSSYIEISGNTIHDIGRVVDSGSTGRGAIYLRFNNHHWNITRNLSYNIGRIGPDDLRMKLDHFVYTGTTSDSQLAAYNIDITYNVVYNVSGNPLNLCLKNSLIANNVFAWCFTNSQGAGVGVVCEGVATGLTFANNIFYELSTSHPFAILSHPGYSGWSVKNNMVFGGRMFETTTSATTAAMDGGNYGRTDCENGEVNPKFVNAVKSSMTSADFHLQSTSPAINKGVSVGLTYDFSNNSLVGVPDMGSYEYGGQVSSTPTLYYNVQMSATATKNDCGTGYTGSTVTYTVKAGTYSSSLSQADADAKASSDLTANKQTYANTNGTCTAVTPTTYYNTQVSRTATKNDCGTGYTGSTVTYTVAAKKYSSTISQADADSKATDDLNANTQSYANANGTCTAATVYYNTSMSATATKNDCDTGYTGSTVTYTVSAGKYSSTISLNDANQKAINDLNANKQAYANANGTCTRIKWWQRDTRKWWQR